MKVLRIKSQLRRLKKISPELSYANCFKEKQFTTVLIAFRSTKNSDSQQINHDDKDVVCHVIKGNGRLCTNNKRILLRRGMICHITKGTPHDFAAGKSGDLVLFYSLIKT